MTAKIADDIKQHRKDVWARLCAATGWVNAEIAIRMGLSRPAVVSYLKTSLDTSNAPSPERLQQMADLVGARAAEILKMAALREAAHPLTREEFESGVSMPHGNVPGTAETFVMSSNRIDIVGSTGRLGHLTVAGLSKRDALDAAWERYLFLAKPKTRDEMRKLVDDTLSVVEYADVDASRSSDPFTQSSATALNFWFVNVYGPVGVMEFLTAQRSPAETSEDAIDRITEAAFVNYDAAMHGKDARFLSSEERLAQKMRFRDLRSVFKEMTFEKVGEIMGRHPTSIVSWSDDTKKISPHAAVIDFLQWHLQDWASDVMIAAEEDHGFDPERIASIQPGLPVGYDRVIRRAVAIHDETAAHWKTRAAEAIDGGLVPEGVRSPI
ncbi:hypothetical protein [Mesorhizobium sp. A623]